MNDARSKVFFSKSITPENVIKLYKLLGFKPLGNIAVKVHSGEAGNQNFLRPAFWKPMVDYIGGTIVEANTAYGGERNTVEKHMKLFEVHGWSKYFKVDLLDAEGPDMTLAIPDGIKIKKDLVGKHISNYDSMVVLSHFKGHPMGGFGGALKQLSIGCASSAGKAYIHSAGVNADPAEIWSHVAPQDDFLDSMADAASAVVSLFGGRIAYINVMCNLSVDCDCCAVAEDPCMKDIGILASLDPVAIDKACVDLVYASNDRGRDHLVERIESRHGIRTVESAASLGIGNLDYELIEIE